MSFIPETCPECGWSDGEGASPERKADIVAYRCPECGRIIDEVRMEEP